MTTYTIVDVANLFHRVRHVVQGDAYTKAGMTLHIVFRSLRRLHREFKSDHMVFCVEGKSWRYAVYPQYKAKRKLDRAKKQATPAEAEEEAVFFEVMNDFTNYIAEKTRCTVLQSDGVEGDDFVARWIQLHPNDQHIILSGDTDFIQLLSPNVKLFDGVNNRLISTDGVFDENGDPQVFSIKSDSGKLRVVGPIKEIQDKHEKEQRKKQREHILVEKERAKTHLASEQAKKLEDADYKPRPYVAEAFKDEEFQFEPEPEWWRKALFVKLIRGDTGDGVQSCYPGVRYNGSAKKVGICEAWDDRHSKGFNWNNFFLQTWSKITGFDKDGQPIKEEVRVIDEFKMNELLIDLTQQPQEIKDLMDTVIVQAVQKEPVGNVGVHFMKYCGKNDLPALTKEAQEHAAYLNAAYQR